MKKVRKLYYHLISYIFNNGWRSLKSIKDYEKEQSFNALPKTYKHYDVIVNGEIEYRYYYSGCISSDSWVERNVTHFRLSEKHKFPIFQTFPNIFLRECEKLLYLWNNSYASTI